VTPPPTWSLDRYRPLLRVQVRQLELDPRLRRRFDSSDLVQETLLRAHRGLAGFRGTTEGELVAWLQQIVANAAAEATRHERAGKRDVALERSVHQAVAESSARLGAFLEARQATPSEQAERQEQLLRLADAIDRLPEDQRDVVIHRDLLGSPVASIAESLAKTEKAVAGLLLRGRRRLRELLGEPE
jgi:RNA polymerase sigma-70 factor (ECF subfamily)